MWGTRTSTKCTNKQCYKRLWVHQPVRWSTGVKTLLVKRWRSLADTS